MKKLLFVCTVLGLGTLLAFTSNTAIEIGDNAPLADVKMKDVSGKSYSLSDLKQKNGLLVIFSCNTCPFVLGWEDTYPGLGKLTKKNNIGMVLVNSNEAKREEEDSLEEMIKHHKEAGYNTPYVVDENNRLADAFDAKTTPHVFLFDKDMNLVYRGLINDKFDNRERQVSQRYLENAIENMAAGKAIDPASTPEKGCSIKRVKA